MTQNNEPLVSIVVPLKNVCTKIDLLLRCIDDITVSHEVIFVNDSSTDDSYRKVSMYCSKFNNKRIYSGSYNGPGLARDFGIRSAKGVWIWLVDADDIIISEVVNSKEYFDNKEMIDIISFQTKEDIRDGGGVSSYKADTKKSKYEQFRDFGRIGSKLFKREWLLNNEIFYEKAGVATDSIFVANAVSSSPRVIVFDKVIYVVILTENSITTTVFDWRRLSRILVSLRISEILNIKNESNFIKKAFFIMVYESVFLRVLYEVRAHKGWCNFFLIGSLLFFIMIELHKYIGLQSYNFNNHSKNQLNKRDKIVIFFISIVPKVFNHQSKKLIGKISNLSSAKSACREFKFH